MKTHHSLQFIFYLLITVAIGGCAGKQNKKDVFSVAFLTDIHLNKGDNGCFDGFLKALETARQKDADFFLTGGDNVDIDVLKDDSATAHELYQRFLNIKNESPVPIYPTIGNHDRYSGAYSDDPMRGSALFESYFEHSYYTFAHKGWQFIVVNTVQVVDGKYAIAPQQYEWLKGELKKIGTTAPIVLVGHVPVLSVYTPAISEKYGFDSFSNFREILNLFTDYNLKLVLQGHQHLYEEIYTRGVQYITGGAVSASWWGGPYYGTQEGFLFLTFYEDDFDWEYVDYGWEVKSKK